MTTAQIPANPPTVPSSPSSSPPLAVQTFEFCREVEIAAPLEVAWEATLLQMSEENEMPDGKKYPMKLEPFPGGRWYRDLGQNTGHYWGHIQVIKPPALLEICGPLFMSFPATNHVQYRLTAEGGKTRLKLTHRSFGNLPRDLGEKGMDEGWEFWLTRVRDIALRLASTRA